MTSRAPNTPGIVGYLLCVVVSFVVCAVLLVVPLLAANGEFVAMVIYVPAAVGVVGVVGLPVALVGVLAMELSCRRVAAQPVHVLVGALAGGVATVGYLPLIGLMDLGLVTSWIAVIVGGSAAFGRAAVVPCVESRRRHAAARERGLALSPSGRVP